MTNENTNLAYVFICGIVGVCGMIVPGLSGSYILILLGNYELLMVTSFAELGDAFINIEWSENTKFRVILNDG